MPFIEKDIKLRHAEDSQVNTRLAAETLCPQQNRGRRRRAGTAVPHDPRRVVVDREEITEIARGVVKDIGYDQKRLSRIMAPTSRCWLHGQSPDIAMGVNAKKKKGTEEEGRATGHDVRLRQHESEVYEKGSYMPAPIYSPTRS